MNSFFPAEGVYPQNYVADQSRIHISELHLTNSPHLQRFKTQASSCSGFLSEAMVWIKEVDKVVSVDNFKTSRSLQVYAHVPNFEMLDARIASALNKIIQNSYFKKKVCLEEQKAQKEDRFLRGRQITYMI